MEEEILIKMLADISANVKSMKHDMDGLKQTLVDHIADDEKVNLKLEELCKRWKQIDSKS